MSKEDEMMTEETFYKETVVLYLNYNSAEMIIKSVKELQKHYSGDIIIVDNASAQEDKKKLEILSGVEGVRILYNTENGGYAKGNNFGIKWIEKNMPLKEQVVIINPDIIVENDILMDMYKIVKKNMRIAALSSRLLYNGIDRGKQDFGWKFPDDITLVFGDTFIGKRLRINVNRLYKTIKSNKALQYVDVVPGCFFMVRIPDIIRAGLFDERTFLYYEEHILAERFRVIGKKEAIYLKKFVDHRHADKDKSLRNANKHYLDRKEHIKSKEVYVKHYSHNGLIIRTMAILLGRMDIISRRMFLQIYEMMKSKG